MRMESIARCLIHQFSKFKLVFAHVKAALNSHIIAFGAKAGMSVTYDNT
jgi:hypothetical protein